MNARIKIIAFLLLLAAVAALAVGCESGIVSGETYYLYSYDTRTDRFVKMGPSLKFGDGLKIFTYSFGDGDSEIMGTVERTQKPDAFLIQCNKEVITLVTERYKAALVASGADERRLALFNALSANVTPQAQYFSYDGNLFLGSAVELYHAAGKDSDSFEGLYHMDDSDALIRIRGGYFYTADEKGEYTVKSSYYTISNGIMCVVSLDKNGRERYVDGVLVRKRYLMAKVSVSSSDDLLGTDLDEQMESSFFVKGIKAEKDAYAGKTVTVLCDSFFSQKIK